jgi:RNA polymerase sigma factor (sigma-70 family)
MQTLFVRHRVALYRWLLRLVGDEALAEDLLSDVFLDVWRQAAKFEARSSVSTWLLAIARYKTLSARRRRIDAELDEEVSVIIADPADNPELVLQKKNQAELVRHSLARLSPGARRGHRPCLLSRQIGQGRCRDSRGRRGHGKDAHVLRAEEAGGVGRDRVVWRCRSMLRYIERSSQLA